MASRTDVVEIFHGMNQGYFWRRKSPNGEIISHSESYSTRSNARRGAKRANPDLARSQFKNV